MEPITVSVPIYIQVSKKQKFALNLNQYRNAHFQILNKAKVEFGKIVAPLIKQLHPMSSLSLTYTLFFGSKRAIDTSNICSIVDKFFSDTLTNEHIIPDDNATVISDIHYLFGGIDVSNPRVEVTIHDYQLLEPKEEPMRIILVQSEIEQAIKQFVLGQIQLKDGQDVTIDFKNTRGEDGATAEINVTAQGAATKPAPLPAQTQMPKPVTTPAPAVVEASKPVTQASPAPVATPTATEQPVVVTPTNATPTPITPAGSEPDTGTTAEAPKSLFANLTKPTNS